MIRRTASIHHLVTDAYSDDDIARMNRSGRAGGFITRRAPVADHVAAIAKPSDKILDFGAGLRAVFTKELRAKGLDVTAYDFAGNVDPDLHDPKALKRKYDIVFASRVLNVQPTDDDVAALLTKLHGLLKAGGVLVINYPESPRNPKMDAKAVAALIKDIMGVEPKRVSGSPGAPVWEVRLGAVNEEMVSPEASDADALAALRRQLHTVATSATHKDYLRRAIDQLEKKIDKPTATVLSHRQVGGLDVVRLHNVYPDVDFGGEKEGSTGPLAADHTFVVVKKGTYTDGETTWEVAKDTPVIEEGDYPHSDMIFDKIIAPSLDNTEDVSVHLAGHIDDVVSGRVLGTQAWIWGALTPDGAKWIRKLFPHVKTVYETEAAANESLAPTERNLKKDYLFRQAAGKQTGIPGFEAVWKRLVKDGDIGEEVAELSDDPEVEEQYTAATGKLPNDDFEAYYQWYTDTTYEPKMREKYAALVASYKEIDGHKCWRMIGLKPGVDPSRLENLGVSWTLERTAANIYNTNKAQDARGRYVRVVFEGRVDLKSVDWFETMVARMSPTRGDYEQEITFLKNAPIHVHAYEERGIGMNRHEVKERVVIEATRRC